MIPDEAVEAAAREYHGSAEASRPWGGLAPMVRRLRLKKMRAALEAAAPNLGPQPWVRAHAAKSVVGYRGDGSAADAAILAQEVRDAGKN